MPVDSKPHILVVDDDPQIGEIVTRYLSGQGLRTTVAGDGTAMRAALEEERVNLVLLDLGLPGDDGLTLTRELRDRWQLPVIIVSGRGEAVERIVGLELGADDYVTKPFDLRELLARIRSVLRRSQLQQTPVAPGQRDSFSFEGFHLDASARRLSDADGREIPLTTGEMNLLLTLLEHPNQVMSRDQLMSRIHGRDPGPFDRAIDMQIGRLRRKIEADPANPALIKSIRGTGYLFAARVKRA